MRSDPKVRRDGKCALPTCNKPRRIPARTYANTVDHETDPFCSTACARDYHGVDRNMAAGGTGLGYAPGRRRIYN